MSILVNVLVTHADLFWSCVLLAFILISWWHGKRGP